MFFATALKYYKRREVQEALIRHAADREVSVRYGPDKFGKRPDTITYPADVLASAQRRVTSFHCSEERWQDPLALQTGASRKQLDDLRIGWDLVLDIDCPYWTYSKLTAHLFIKALQEHGITSVSCKFSGSKGFHIGVPFEAFPETINDQQTSDLFPEAPRAIAQYLLDYIEEHYIKVEQNTISFAGQHSITFSDLKKELGDVELLKRVCPKCKNERKEQAIYEEFVCPGCGTREKGGGQYKKCGACNSLMEKFTTKASACPKCESTLPPIEQFNVESLIEVDTILLASRHLFRMAYSLHEKSGLASVPIDPNTVLDFEKKQANPETISFEGSFLERRVPQGEATDLLAKSLIYATLKDQEALEERKKYDVPEDAIPDEYFPPCITLIFQGLKDGKKRALFILTNFLYSCGWTADMVKDRIYDWNEQNPEKLREVVIKGHLQLKEKKSEIILPPNCTSDYYRALGVCHPDEFCRTIKNPAQYTVKKHRLANFRRDGKPKAKRAQLTEEQKAMRKAYREKKKQEKKVKESE